MFDNFSRAIEIKTGISKYSLCQWASWCKAFIFTKLNFIRFCQPKVNFEQGSSALIYHSLFYVLSMLFNTEKISGISSAATTADPCWVNRSNSGDKLTRWPRSVENFGFMTKTSGWKNGFETDLKISQGTMSTFYW